MVFNEDMAIPTRLKLLRVSAGLSQQEAADRIGCTQKTVWTWENGRFTPNAFMKRRIVEVYGPDAAQVWEETS